ncbi:helix-turn-helix domain-containing protein [Streptomyces europaeiscabiei]|uniref:helix-turn-helix domain-containing protein n=1 Tax=Streptomyces europaeiscabiei TaxID=146819 RepID=UPI0029B1F584|nr:LysR family transcriptional regulator [Streptomyces europaeiscabiei]MDX2758100.1 LysR family transcriptional regulator [Streptomyces europaeiscabiei]
MAADFSLGQPEYFVAVANTGSMRAAAVRCHASRAGISTGIADLERRLGPQLPVRRRAKSVLLTISDPLEEAGVVIAHAPSVSPTRRTRAFARNACDTPATAKATA